MRFIFTLIYTCQVILEVLCCEQSRPSKSFLYPLVQYAHGLSEQTNSTRVLSPIEGFVSIAEGAGYSVQYTYQLQATTLRVSSVQGCSCSVKIQTVVKKSSDGTYYFGSATTQTYNDWVRAGFLELANTDFYCAASAGDCGADIPLYLYSYNTSYSYYVSTPGMGPDSGKDAYPAGYPPGRPDLVTVPICYVWSDMTLTTTTTTTTTSPTTTTTNVSTSTISTTSGGTAVPITNSSTTSNFESNSTTSTSLTTSTTTVTTVNSGTNSTTTTTASTNNNETNVTTTTLITTTSSSNSVTTTASGSTNTTDVNGGYISGKKNGGSWRWIAIGGVILAIVGLSIFALICCTMKFISPSKRSNVVKYSGETYSSQNVLPPQPVQPSVSGQISTGYMGAIPPGYVPP